MRAVLCAASGGSAAAERASQDTRRTDNSLLLKHLQSPAGGRAAGKLLMLRRCLHGRALAAAASKLRVLQMPLPMVFRSSARSWQIFFAVAAHSARVFGKHLPVVARDGLRLEQCCLL